MHALRNILAVAFVGLIAIPLQAKTVDIIILTADGGRVVQKVSDDVTFWGAAEGDGQAYRFAGVENLEALPNLESIELQNLSAVRDYAFLQKVRKLKKLHIGSCTVHDLGFLAGFPNLEALSLSVIMPNAELKKIRQTPIDFSSLKRLRFVVFTAYSSEGERYAAVPPFINVQSKPFIDLANNGIAAVTDDDLRLLTQYSLVSLVFNPITENSAEKNKLAKLNVRFDSSKELPKDIQGYYEQNR